MATGHQIVTDNAPGVRGKWFLAAGGGTLRRYRWSRSRSRGDRIVPDAGGGTGQG